MQKNEKAISVRTEVQELISKLPKTKEVFRIITEDKEIKEMIDQANRVAILRWGFNDHGIVHALTTTRNAVKMALLLRDAKIPLNAESETGVNFDEALSALVMASMIHDIGNMASREMHEWTGAILAVDYLRKIIADAKLNPRLIGYALEAIICHMGNQAPTSYEAKLLTIADALDMEEGRARLPYKLKGPDIHKFSAMAIKHVLIEKGNKKPIKLTVKMTESAGVFQIESVLMKKASASKFAEIGELSAEINGKTIDYF